MIVEKIIGRDAGCDYIIIDPQKRVSRKHLRVKKTGSGYVITDLGSLNGTYINGEKIKANEPVNVNAKSKVTLSTTYILDFKEVFDSNDDRTVVLGKQNADGEQTILIDGNGGLKVQQGSKTIVLDQEKTTLGEALQFDQTKYITIGRKTENNVVISNLKVSGFHCKARLLSPIMIEIIDLGSSNGTFADGEKLLPNKSYVFSSCVSIKLGADLRLDLKKIFPEIHILPKTAQGASSGNASQGVKAPAPNAPLSATEKKQFEELEAVWNEYYSRQKSVNDANMKYTIGGSIVGAAFSLFGGPVGAVIGIASTISGRYLASRKSSEIKDDVSYENMFLQVYACPRCQESFQKKPWITIRDCFKCKVKFR